MSPKNWTTIDLTVTAEYDPMLVDNTDDELVSTIAPVETDKPSYQPTTSYYSSYTTITASKYTISPSAALPAALAPSSKSHNMI